MVCLRQGHWSRTKQKPACTTLSKTGEFMGRTRGYLRASRTGSSAALPGGTGSSNWGARRHRDSSPVPELSDCRFPSGFLLPLSRHFRLLCANTARWLPRGASRSLHFRLPHIQSALGSEHPLPSSCQKRLPRTARSLSPRSWESF